MNEVRRIVGAADAYQHGYFGQQIGIAVLDSGIFLHKDFVEGINRISVYKDFISGNDNPSDQNGHGTHIAGIIAGSGAASNGRYMGMAPMAELIVVRVLDAYGNGSSVQVCQAIEWVIQNKEKYHIRIMNISVGVNSRQRSKESRQLEAAAEYAWNKGLIVVAAAGNNGPFSGSVTSPGTNKKIITVGAVLGAGLNNTSEEICSFSGRGPTYQCVNKPDIMAPGYKIISCGNAEDKPYLVRSGTSMAAPVVAGGIALILNKYPDMTNKEVKQCLRKSAVSLRVSVREQGWGLFSVPYCLDGRCEI